MLRKSRGNASYRLWNTRCDLSHDEVVLRDVQSGERTALVLSTSLIDAVGRVV